MEPTQDELFELAQRAKAAVERRRVRREMARKADKMAEDHQIRIEMTQLRKELDKLRAMKHEHKAD